MKKSASVANSEHKNKMEYRRKRDRQKVRGRFKFYEVPGGTLSFVYRKYKGDPVEKFTMIDGEVYEVPIGVAKHLNNNGWYPVHQYKQEEGGPKMRIGQRVDRFGFESLDFVDVDEVAPEKQLVTVEQVV